jgi:ubiquinone biosynthesis protein Coq4
MYDLKIIYMFRKILELRILKAIVALSKNPESTEDIHFINDSLLAGISNAEREKFTRIFFEYPEFKNRYNEPRTAEYYDIEALSRLPENTLGYRYTKFLKDHKYSVEWYPTVEEISPVHFARNRQYQTHDILHTITGFSGKPLDEIGLQGFYTGQAVPNPTAMIVFTAATLNRLRVSEPAANIELMEHMLAGYTMGKNAKRVIFRRWEDDWNTDISKLREQLGIRPHVEHGV